MIEFFQRESAAGYISISLTVVCQYTHTVDRSFLVRIVYNVIFEPDVLFCMTLEDHSKIYQAVSWARELKYVKPSAHSKHLHLMR